MLETGTEAPDFTATLDDGSTFRLSNYRGKKNVVLYFYPKDFSGGCTREACSFRDNYDVISRYDAIIVGVSSDDEASHRGFREKHGLPFPLIADTDGTLAETYAGRSMFGLLRTRATYVIDKQGIIRDVLKHDILIGRHVPEVVEALERIGGAPRR